MQEDEAEEFRLPLSGENLALGRLGRIYKTLDRKTGRVSAVECIDVVDDADESDEDSCSAEIARRVLQTELANCRDAINSENGRQVFCYDSVSCSRGKVYLRSSSSVNRSLTALQQDFGRLHPLAVKQYIFQIVQGLRVLHENRIWCGGLSLSSLLLCGGDIVKIAAWFPSLQTVNTLQGQNILADPQVHRASLDSPSAYVEMAQDVTDEKVQFVGYSRHRFPKIPDFTQLVPLSEVLTHPYFSAASSIDSFMSNSLSEISQEQRHIIGTLTKQDLNKCQLVKRQYLQQIRAWQAQFEKKYRRKPKPADRPAGIVRLQGRCQALNERMQEVNDRLAAIHGSIYRMITDKESLGIDASRQPTSEDNLDQLKSTPDTTSGPVGFESSMSDSFGREGIDHQRRKHF